MRRSLTLTLLIVILMLAACGDDDDSAPAPDLAATSEASAAAPGNGGDDGKSEQAAEPGSGRAEAKRPGTVIVVADSEYGSMLFNAEQQAIYLFDKEESDAAQCYGDCAAAWPPVLTDGEPQAGQGAQAKLLGTTVRDDGTTQVTYNGHPLYFYAHEGPGQVLCHNIAEFGGLWLVVQPNGDAAPA